MSIEEPKPFDPNKLSKSELLEYYRGQRSARDFFVSVGGWFEEGTEKADFIETPKRRSRVVKPNSEQKKGSKTLKVRY